MKHYTLALLFSLTCFHSQSVNAQEYLLPRWGFQGCLHSLFISQTNQGSGFLNMAGPVLDFNIIQDPLTVLGVRSGLLLLSSDGGAVGLPLELRMGILDGGMKGKFGFYFGGGLIFQSGEAFYEEKSSVPFFNLDGQFMRPNRKFYFTFGIRYIALPSYIYQGGRWTREASGGGGIGLGLSFGCFLGRWQEAK